MQEQIVYNTADDYTHFKVPNEYDCVYKKLLIDLSTIGIKGLKDCKELRIPPLFDMVDNSVVENRIAKVNKDGSLQIKGEIIIEDNCERVRFDKDGNIYLKSYFTGLNRTSKNFQFKITKNTVSARFIVENSEI